MKTMVTTLSAALVLAATPLAFALSDGNYSPARQHCSGHADNIAWPGDPTAGDEWEDGCHNFTLTVSDVGGHEYFGFGLQQTGEHETGPVPDVIPFGTGSSTHAFEVWYDGGDGCTRYTSDANAPGAPTQGSCPWFDATAPNYYGPSPAPDPSSGLRIYIGADDNLAGGEHDSSHYVNNGPSDGGAVVLNADPASIAAWVAEVQAMNPDYVLKHPLPFGDAGFGFCTDGICISIQTQERTALQGARPGDRHVANYDQKTFDPEDCSSEPGKDAGPKCDGKTVSEWNDEEQRAVVEPGVQIYEDPDAQASPLGSYPIPAIYVGTCGVVIGGGDLQMPESDSTNSKGQIVISTCTF